MNLRAIIFDVYGTLLEVSPPPANAQEKWAVLWGNLLHRPPSLNLSDFARGCDILVAREHARAHAQGIPYPEVCWPAITSAVVPELNLLSQAQRDEFLFEQAQLWHSVQLMPGVADTMRLLVKMGTLMGIASNAQAYTLRELSRELAVAGLDMGIFDPHLCFWSFEHGFSKPDPHVFRNLSARLQTRGINPENILMVGDRLDNDIEPALAQGWSGWHLNSDSAKTWRHLQDFISENQQP